MAPGGTQPGELLLDGLDDDKRVLEARQRELQRWKARALEAEAQLKAIGDFLDGKSRLHALPSKAHQQGSLPDASESGGSAAAQQEGAASHTVLAGSAPSNPHPTPLSSNSPRASPVAPRRSTNAATSTSRDSPIPSRDPPDPSRNSCRSCRLNGRKVKVEAFFDDDDESADAHGVLTRKRPRLVADCAPLPRASPGVEQAMGSDVRLFAPAGPFGSRGGSSGEDARGGRATVTSPEYADLEEKAVSRRLQGPHTQSRAAHPAMPSDQPERAVAESKIAPIHTLAVTMPQPGLGGKYVATELEASTERPARAKSTLPDISAVRPTPSAMATRRVSIISGKATPTQAPSGSAVPASASSEDSASTSSKDPAAPSKPPASAATKPPTSSTSKPAAKQEFTTQPPKDALSLPALLASVPSFPIPPPPSSPATPIPCVSRRFLLHLYGCTETALLATLHANPRAATRLRAQSGPQPPSHPHTPSDAHPPPHSQHPPSGQLPAAFANLSMNPRLPPRAGAPGVLLTRRADALFADPVALFVGRGVNAWEYVGDYVSRRVRAVTGAEFRAMEGGVQRTWARSICKKKRPQCWPDMRAIVFDGDPQPRKDRASEDAMLQALRSGTTHLDVLLFECKAYNTDIAEDIRSWSPRKAELQSLWAQSQPGGRSKALTRTKPGPKVNHVVDDDVSAADDLPGPRTLPQRKRKRISVVGYDDADDGDDEDYRPD